jgi:hypothetical protein
MDKSRFSSIAHGGLPVWNPVAVGLLQQVVSRFALPDNGVVLDIGRGRGHVLQLILSQYPVRGAQAVGIDEGFDLVSCSQCRLAEWDDYEDQYASNIEEFVRANPHDPDAESMLERLRPWREA